MVPFPRSHLHWLGPPVLKSLKLTTSGTQPSAGEAEKFVVSWLFAIRHIKASSIEQVALFTSLDNIGIRLLVLLISRVQITPHTKVLTKTPKTPKNCPV